MAVSENNPVFLKAVDATDEVKSAEYVGKLFLEVISEVGHENVVQLITDNAAVCKATGLRVKAKHPSIFWTPCVVHTLNLALKNICTPDKDLLESVAFTIYNKYSKLKLLGVTETRFVSTLILVKRIFQVKSELQRMVIDESWRFYREKDSQKAQKIKEILVSDLWWDNVEYMLDFSEPIVSMLRVADTDTPMLHLVYEKWDSMIEEIRKRVFRHKKKNTLTDESKFYDEMHEVLVRRWNKSSTLLHCLAYSLNPKYYSNEWLSEGISRVPPNLDEEISEGRNACFERLFSSVTMFRKVREEYGKFATAIGNFGRWEALSELYTINPLAWWGNHGSNAPTLASHAFRYNNLYVYYIMLAIYCLK
ncbi:hypothetical protein HHK36_023127 [Tetracentron sinense]|uniref:DUF659 domain-containing protein n=1 Tax=Tetracentron sinense TaxID=13715 RepID=A0A835D4Z3_TETSI|nr:hypothetical protein HHK36_023127 [Tetracentron sinense]